MLAKGYDWDRISTAYLGRINHEAIAEIVKLADENDKPVMPGEQRETRNPGGRTGGQC